MINIGNLLNNKILFTAQELQDHARLGGPPPSIEFGDAVLACQILNKRKGELGVTLQIQGIGLDDAAGAQIQTEFYDRQGRLKRVVTRVGTRHRLVGCDLNREIYLTVLSIPEEVLYHQSLVTTLSRQTTVFSARKVKRGGRENLGPVEIHLERHGENISFRILTNTTTGQQELNGMTLRVSCYGYDGSQADVNVQIDANGSTSQISGVNPNFGVRVTFL